MNRFTASTSVPEHRTHFLPQGPRAVLDGWREAVTAAGDDPWNYRVGIIRGCLVTDDAERDWPLVREAERYRMRLYNRFFAESGQTGLGGAGVQIPQTWIVGDVDHCVSQLAGFVAEHGITDIVTWGVPPGLTTFDMTASLAAFATKVAPRVKALVAAGTA